MYTTKKIFNLIKKLFLNYDKIQLLKVEEILLVTERQDLIFGFPCQVPLKR